MVSLLVLDGLILYHLKKFICAFVLCRGSKIIHVYTALNVYFKELCFEEAMIELVKHTADLFQKIWVLG